MSQLSVVNSPLRMSHLQPLDEGGRGADLPAPILGQHQGSPSSEFASLRERMASVKRAPRQASLDQQGTGGEDDSMATMSSDLRDRLRAQVSSAKMKVGKATDWLLSRAGVFLCLSHCGQRDFNFYELLRA